MNRKVPLAALASAATMLGLAACSSSSAPNITGSGSSASSTPGSGSSKTLVMEGSPTGAMTVNFNPFSSNSPANTAGATNLVYEPLMQFNLTKPGSAPEAWLATAESFSNDGKTLTLTLKSGVKFTDGSAFDAANVAWQFNTMKTTAALNTNGLPIDSATAVNSTTVQINFSQSQYTNLYNILSTLQIPEDVWSKVNASTYTDGKPVGTGPYTVTSFTSQGINLTANPNYWGGKPAVTNVEFPAYDSNNTANLALENGQLDWAGNFVQNIQQDFIDKSSDYHDGDVVLQTQTLTPNLGDFPFNAGPNGAAGLAVREAISDGIDRQTISTEGEGTQQPAATGPASLTGLSLPLDNQYVTSATSGYQTEYNPSKAESILKAAGWTMKGGYFYYGGKELSITIEDPSAYTDYIADDDIVASELKAIGMNVTVDPVSVAKFGTDVADGTFQLVNRYGSGGTTPYNQYNSWLNDALTAKVGSNATGDQERFHSPQADALLNSFASASPSQTATQDADIEGLEKIVATQLPIIPMVFGVAWAEYSTVNFTGWPTQSGSGEYDPAQPEGPYDEVVILHLKPVS